MIEARRKRTAALAVTVLMAGLIGTTVGSGTTASAVPPAPRPGSSRPATPSSAAAPGTYVALTPARVFDGRVDGVATAHGTVGVPVLGRVGVPSTGVGAIALTLAATGQTASGYVTAYAAGTARPTASNLNFVPGQDVANSVVVPVGAGGAVDLYNGSPGTTDFLVDVAGYYQSGSASVAGAFTALPPTRRLDTRTGTGGARPGPRGVVRVNVGIVDATVLMNVTVTQPAAAGYVTAYPDGAVRPQTSNLSFGKGQTIADQMLVAVGANGVLDLYNGSVGSTQLVLDVVGSYRPGVATAPGALQPVGPRRQLDTRTRPSGPVPAHGEYVDRVGGTAGVPATGVSSLLLDVTVVTPTRSGYLRVQAALEGVDTVPPPTSSLNFAAGHTVAGLVIVTAGTGANIGLYLHSNGPANLVVDVLGYTLDGPGASRGSISGTVTVSPGSADGVTVRAYNGTDLAASTITAADGTYTLAGLPASTAGDTICVVAPTADLASQCYNSVEWDSTAPPPPGTTPIPVQGGMLYAGLDVYLRPPLPTGVITGELTAADTGKPLAGALVGLLGQSYTATTGSDGRYQISDVGPGSYQVCFTPDDTAAGTPATGYASACHVGPVAVTDGHTTAGVDAVVPLGAAVSGRVTAAADGAPIANVDVSASYTGTHRYFGATTAADGTYRIIGLPGGAAVTVCFSGAGGTGGPSAAGYLNACHHSGAGTDPTPVTVTAGSTTTGVDAALTAGGGISGTVRAGTAGVNGIDVYVFSADGVAHNVTESGADGSYTIAGMLPGTYTVCFQYDADVGGTAYRDQCYHDIAWDGGSVPADLTPVSVTADVITKNIDASLTHS